LNLTSLLLDAQGRKWQERQNTRALDRNGQGPLMSGAITGNPAGDDLAALGNECAQGPDILVVNLQGFVGAKAANLAPSAGPSPHPAAIPRAALHAAVAAVTAGTRASPALPNLFGMFVVSHR
jgi:hypothetical protein